ncbi:O-acyltransferase [Neptunitalea chrysea]|uniref:O-acyltransferase n=1 Tax=Neptunitalea chrysea TaxID=1647581 RepID=A0A9W6B5I7_9FLAO|nr:MBOAT family O-acyltransferase [Neptunitalea chrysea]GLB53028.1 O-acyltransferase [Neptunitalea chrysea]
MLFNSIDFALFFPIVFALYWGITNHHLKLQNYLIVVASYFFYGWWNPYFLLLIIASTLTDYGIGLALNTTNETQKRKLLLWVSILINLGLLGFFKYFNFFIDNVNTAFTFLGVPIHISSLHIILPVGISFYTFQTLSYTIDVYRKKIEPTKDIVAFAAFVSFFPQLVAGPIERASHLLPQFFKPRKFIYKNATDGLRQILWGLFKKMVIADNCAFFANQIFGNYEHLNGSSLVFGAFFFTFQIYGDFSGYSDIAIGTARLLGFDLKQNFAYPYFSRNIAEFWRRWHISLTTWFRDYVYIPLGGSYGNKWQTVRNTFIIFLVSGFWHGANWTFILWGFLHAVCFLPLLLTNTNRKYLTTVAENSKLPNATELLQMLGTFILVALFWIVFRAENITDLFAYYSRMLSPSLISVPDFDMRTNAVYLLGGIAFLIFVEWNGRRALHPLQHIGVQWNKPLRYAFYYTIIIAICWFSGAQQQFIYFDF